MKRTPLKRAGWLKRSRMKRRTSPVQRRNAARRRAAFAHAYHSRERVAFVQALPSVVSGQGPCENAHVRNGGMGRKASYGWIVPLTAAEHRALHQLGRQRFSAAYHIDLEEAAWDTQQQWERDQHQRGES